MSGEPPAATQIRVGDIVRNTGPIEGLSLPVGEHVVCFFGPEECLVPGCRVVVIEDGEQRPLVVEILRSVELEVVVEPNELRPCVTKGVGSAEVCLQELAGYEPVGCHTVELTADKPHRLVVDYEIVTPAVEEPVNEGTIEEEEALVEADPAAGEADVTIVSSGSTSPHGPTWTASIQVLATDGTGAVTGTSIEVVWSAGTPATCSV